MCGIAGVYSPAGGAPGNRQLLHAMLNSVRHRGPDDEGIMSAHQLLLGHRRLSIIDINDGKQPLANEDNSVWVSFNGEIYNFLELKQSLVQRGHKFRTRTDSEVLVHMYEEFGIEFIHKLHGMFAFALWDQNTSSLYLVRDRLGVKPLYYMWHDDRLYFASELKAIRLVPDIDWEVDINAVNHYLSYKYTPIDRSIYKRLHKLPPGTYLKCVSERSAPKTYWTPDKRRTHVNESRIAEELLEATRSRLMSEVPLGVSLSGGIDSAIVIANMASSGTVPLRSFTVQFEGESVDESQLASVTANRFRSEHKTIRVERVALDELSRIVWHLDEPFAVYSAVPTFLLSHAQKKYATVILSGDGGDEAFGGYTRYRIFNSLGIIRKIGLASFLSRIPGARYADILSMAKRVGEICLLPPSAQYDKLVSTFDWQYKQDILSHDMARELQHDLESPIQHWFNNSPDGVDALSYTDYKTYLPGDVLHKVDRMSMAASVEVRSPFLDHRIVELGLSLTSAQRYGLFKSKVALRNAYRSRLPSQVLRGKKKGFSVPLQRWFQDDFSTYAHDVLTSRKAIERGYFNNQAVMAILNDMHNGKTSDLRRIWSLLMLELWHRVFVDCNSTGHAMLTTD